MYDGVFGSTYQEPQEELEKPFTVVDVTAKEATVMNAIDEALGIDPQDESRGDGVAYYELVENIKAVDEKRDQEWMDNCKKYRRHHQPCGKETGRPKKICCSSFDFARSRHTRCNSPVVSYFYHFDFEHR